MVESCTDSTECREHGDSKRRISKEIIIKGASAKIGDKVKIYAGRSKQLRRIVIKEKEN